MSKVIKGNGGITMIFGKTHEDASLRLSNRYSQRQWFAWFPVREIDGRWIWLETVTKKWSAACGGGWRYYANPRRLKV